VERESALASVSVSVREGDQNTKRDTRLRSVICKAFFLFPFSFRRKKHVQVALPQAHRRTTNNTKKLQKRPPVSEEGQEETENRL
jgi:hypothetical protein